MSGWKVMVPLALAILAIFGVILLIYSIVGSGDSSAGRRRSPTDTPVAIETPAAGAYFAEMSAILSDSTVDVLSSPIETP
jgi:hypothetical protein